MSRNTLILLVALCGAIAGLIVFSKLRSGQLSPVAGSPSGSPTTTATTPPGQGQVATPPVANRLRPGNTSPAATSGVVVPTDPSTGSVSRTAIAAASPTTVAPVPRVIQAVATNAPEETVPVVKPVPVMEKDYAATTNRDTRLDIMMDIADTPTAEAVKALTRLFEVETDTDLKVDLLDSLLGIEGFKDEKLIMLTIGARQGLPAEVRQSAIDGLIDLDDQRVIPVLNGLLNDPDPEIREGAKDALDMVQSQPAVKLK